MLLTTGFITNINNSDLPNDVKTTITSNSSTGVEIVPIDSINQIAIDNGLSQQQADTITNDYLNAQLDGLKQSIFFLVVLSVFSLALSRGIPNTLVASSSKKAT